MAGSAPALIPRGDVDMANENDPGARFKVKIKDSTNTVLGYLGATAADDGYDTCRIVTVESALVFAQAVTWTSGGRWLAIDTVSMRVVLVPPCIGDPSGKLKYRDLQFKIAEGVVVGAEVGDTVVLGDDMIKLGSQYLGVAEGRVVPTDRAHAASFDADWSSGGLRLAIDTRDMRAVLLPACQREASKLRHGEMYLARSATGNELVGAASSDYTIEIEFASSVRPPRALPPRKPPRRARG
ncbi:hypothetical protein ACNOYE_14040 [Nannocystaceae bacterium ST9]